ncbi:hypothetical protein ZEAMMB73_Zm00001d007320 [Zea mays]|uniref:Uncharacterized protein n=1 Tax=Zea mays TaxID=4577 RepID=A0A1D6F5J0_MAIZE|nr:hypothetical protein ZEAMMB73_Zm00001d007320 [Zea mays]
MAAAGGETMMTREQLLHLFSRFSFVTSLPEVKQRIADAVRDKQEAVAVTTEIQEEILREMGVEKKWLLMKLSLNPENWLKNYMLNK